MNCGKTDIKNTIAFGFEIEITKPSKKHFVREWFGKGSSLLEYCFEKNILKPRYIRYVAPIILIIVKTTIELANITPKLVADIIAIKSVAKAIPKIPAKVLERPLCIALLMVSSTAGPGKRTVAKAIPM